jgi:hypothetical protein
MMEPLRFKDMFPEGLMSPEDDEYVVYRRRKQKRITTSESVEVDEALTTQQRLARRRLMKKLAPKIKLGRERAKRRMPDMKRFKTRAHKAARMFFFKRLSKGISKDQLPLPRRQEIEKRLEKPAMKTRIDRLEKKLLKDVRKKEMERRKPKND